MLGVGCGVCSTALEMTQYWSDCPVRNTVGDTSPAYRQHCQSRHSNLHTAMAGARASVWTRAKARARGVWTTRVKVYGLRPSNES